MSGERTCPETTRLKMSLLPPVTLLAFVTKTEGNRSGRTVPHTRAPLLSSPCRGEGLGTTRGPGVMDRSGSSGDGVRGEPWVGSAGTG